MTKTSVKLTVQGEPRNTTVLIVIGSLAIGGTERHLERILPELLKEGIRPGVFTLSARGALAASLERQGVAVSEPAFPVWLGRWPRCLRRPVRLLVAAFSLVKAQWIQRPTIVHYYLPEAYLVGGFCGFFTPRTIQIMSRRSLNDYQTKYPILARVEKCLHRRMQVVLGNSKAVCEQLTSEGVRESTLSCIYNGISLENFRDLPPPGLTRKALGIDESDLVFVYVANLIPYKGHLDLLDAFSQCHHALPTWKLVLVGKEQVPRPDLHKHVETLGLASNVLFLGARDDVPALLGAADIAVHCSHEEGFSNAVLEAMAAKLPIVATEVGGNPEAVLHGKTGFVVPARDPSAIAFAVQRLAEDEKLRCNFGAAGRERVEKLFSLRACVTSHVRLYSEAASHALVEHD